MSATFYTVSNSGGPFKRQPAKKIVMCPEAAAAMRRDRRQEFDEGVAQIDQIILQVSPALIRNRLRTWLVLYRFHRISRDPADATPFGSGTIDLIRDAIRIAKHLGLGLGERYVRSRIESFLEWEEFIRQPGDDERKSFARTFTKLRAEPLGPFAQSARRRFVARRQQPAA